jgi:hypothetical protein
MARNILVAIKSGTDPIVPLPAAAFHRTLESPIYCPKCEATYFLIVDYDWAISRHFDEESRHHLTLLRKTIRIGHDHGHRITHFETNGVVVTRHTHPDPPPALEELKPLTELPQ